MWIITILLISFLLLFLCFEIMMVLHNDIMEIVFEKFVDCIINV